MTTTCFDYDGDTLAGEETLPQSGGGGGQPGARRNSSPRGSPTRRAVIANRGGGASRTTLAATAAFSTNAAAFSTTALQNAVQTCAAVSFADPSTGSGSHGARVVLSAATSTLGNLGALGRRDIQNGYVFWDNGPDGTFGQDDEPTGGSGTPTTTTEIHDPFGFDADTVSAIGNVILGGVVYDSFGNPLGGGGYGSPSSQDPQPQQDGSLLDPTGLRSDSTGNGLGNPGTGTDVNDDDWPLGVGGRNLMYNPFLAGVNRLAKLGQALGNIAGAFNPLVNGITAFSGQNPDGSCATRGQRIAAAFAAAGTAFGEFAEAGEAAGDTGELASKVPRVRHYTTRDGLNGIKAKKLIFQNRNGGVDFEVEPFGSPYPGLDGPARQTGAFGEGAYVEFDAPPGWQRTNVGPRNTGRVLTGPDGLPVHDLNPRFWSIPWWRRLF